jgi:hypothetical protein
MSLAGFPAPDCSIWMVSHLNRDKAEGNAKGRVPFCVNGMAVVGWLWQDGLLDASLPGGGVLDTTAHIPYSTVQYKACVRVDV